MWRFPFFLFAEGSTPIERYMCVRVLFIQGGIPGLLDLKTMYVFIL